MSLRDPVRQVESRAKRSTAGESNPNTVVRDIKETRTENVRMFKGGQNDVGKSHPANLGLCSSTAPHARLARCTGCELCHILVCVLACVCTCVDVRAWFR